MRLIIVSIVLCLFSNILPQHITQKQNFVLSRKKRWLTFPEGSNFVMTISGLKEILLKVPRGFRTVVECDVFFKLPNKSFRSYVQDLSLHTRHRREVLDGVSKAIETFGLNGDACIKKMICEAHFLQPFRESFLFRHLLFTVFWDPTRNGTQPNCTKEMNNDCNISFIGIILNYIYS